MPVIIVVPTLEEQVKLDSGVEPDVSNLFVREFLTEEECQSYLEGLGSLSDMSDYEIISQQDNRVVIEIEGDIAELEFNSTSEVGAYLKGIEDADGWTDPRAISEGDEVFDQLIDLIEGQAPRP